MTLRRRIERLTEWADESRAMQVAEELAQEIGGSVQVLAAQALQDFRDLNALVSLGLTVEEAVRRFAEEQNLDAEAILAGMAKAAARAGSDTGRPVESE